MTILLAQSAAEIFGGNTTILFTLAAIFGFYMAWNIGANDVANAMGTSVGSKALTLKQAIVVAAVLEFAGAILVGSHVSDKIRSKIFDQGSQAAGKIDVVFDTDAAVTLPKSTIFKTPDGVEFQLVDEVDCVSSTNTSRKDGQRLLSRTADDRFLVVVDAVAVRRGRSGNLAAGATLDPESTDVVQSFSSAVAVAKFTGGRDGSFDDKVELYAYGMLAALLAAAVWLQIATFFGLPVSTTHTIVGAVVGFGMVALDWQLIVWGEIAKIASSWIISPVLAGTASYVVFKVIQRTILFKRDMVGASKRLAPILVFFVFLSISLVTLWKGLKPLNLDMELKTALLLSTAISGLAAIVSAGLLRRVKGVEEPSDSEDEQNPIVTDELERMKSRIDKLKNVAHGDVADDLAEIEAKVSTLKARVSTEASGPGVWGNPQMRATERIFVYLQILTACSLAFAHGANDVANAVGPLSGVIAVLNRGAEGLTTSVGGEGIWILALGGLGIVIGLATWGWRVIETIGKKITELTPTRGFAAQFGASATILFASRFGLPVSTTHILVGAVLGVGFARGLGALNLRVVRDIVVSWIVTLPAGGILAIVFYYGLRAIF